MGTPRIAIGRLTLSAFAVLAFSSSVLADECKLDPVPIELVQSQEGPLLASVIFNGKPMIFRLSTGQFWSSIRPEYTEGLTRQSQPVRALSGGKEIQEIVRVPSFSLGPVNLDGMELYVLPTNPDLHSRVAGNLSANVLHLFDIEMDLSNNSLKFFMPSDCGAKVVRWQNDGVAVIPLAISNAHQLFIPLKLDDRRVNALIDTGYTHSQLNLGIGEAWFNLKPGTPEMEDVTGDKPSLAEEDRQYRHQFEKLEIQGLAFSKPTIYLEKDAIYGPVSNSNSRFDFIFGMEQMRKLHIYLSYRDGRMYVTKSTPLPSAAVSP